MPRKEQLRWTKVLWIIRGLLPIALMLACFGLAPSALATDTDGAVPNGNNADGVGVLTSLTSGAWNSGFGFQALNKDTIGNLNTATGLRGLFNNTEGDANTANGMMALFSNTSGDRNVAIGAQALVFNIDGSDNTAVGTQALSSNTAGTNNTANGSFALFSNTEGNLNTANGLAALYSNATGIGNTAEGGDALVSNNSGSNNTAIGTGALSQNTIGNNNIAVGAFAGTSLTTGDHNIDIGNGGVIGESDTIRIGDIFHTRTFIAAIRDVTTGNADAINVVIDSDGQLGTMSSSKRFKKEIKPMDSASEAIHALKPVTFHYKNDSSGTPQFGLIAEEVAEVNPDLVVRDADGEIYTVRYEAVNAMLLNEFLKEHRTVQELKKEIAALATTVKEQAAQIQKVSAQIEMVRAAPQTVLK